MWARDAHDLLFRFERPPGKGGYPAAARLSGEAPEGAPTIAPSGCSQAVISRLVIL